MESSSGRFWFELDAPKSDLYIRVDWLQGGNREAAFVGQIGGLCLGDP